MRTQNVSEKNQKHFLYPGQKICVRNKCCACGQTGRHLLGSNVSATMCPRLSGLLGPALFLLFVNGIPLHLANSTVDIHADYATTTTTTASAHFSDLCLMTQSLNFDLDAVLK